MSTPAESFEESMSAGEPRAELTLGNAEELPPTNGTPGPVLGNLEELPPPSGTPGAVIGLGDKQHARTQTVLALGSLGILAAFYGAMLTLTATGVFTVEQAGGVVAQFSGLQTLTAAAFGYYFAKK